MITLYIKAISVIAQGITNWDEGKQILTGKKEFIAAKVDKKLTTMLPPNENRRCSRTIQLALSVVQQLLEKKAFNSQQIRYVFSSCNGDLNVFHHISTALAQQGRPVSPIKFHNSVHNAAAGYCAIALKSQSPSTSITAYEDSFANGLLEAAVQASASNHDCLLTGYDEIPPEPLLSLFPIADDFAYSLLLSPDSLSMQSHNNSHALCRLDISITNDQKTSIMENETFEQLRNTNPQAKILPLLYCIANKENKTLYFDDNEQQIAVKMSEFSEENI